MAMSTLLRVGSAHDVGSSILDSSSTCVAMSDVGKGDAGRYCAMLGVKPRRGCMRGVGDALSDGRRWMRGFEVKKNESGGRAMVVASILQGGGRGEGPGGRRAGGLGSKEGGEEKQVMNGAGSERAEERGDMGVEREEGGGDLRELMSGEGERGSKTKGLEGEAERGGGDTKRGDDIDMVAGRRRELILMGGAASLAAAAGVTTRPAWASPVVPPDLTKCDLAVVAPPPGQPGASSQVLCCVPTSGRPAKAFRPPRRSPIRVRRPAHKVGPDYIARYNRAYQLMRALPVTDPRSLHRQADIHCAFCNGAYNQLGSNNKLQVHFSWLFFPWHRWFLYFHERILGSLIGDPTFSLVYWNWDNQMDDGANMMPTMFTKEQSALYDAKRNPNHLPPTINTLNLASLTGTSKPKDVIVKENLNVMYQSVVTATTANLFMGKKYSAGDPEPNVGGTLEMAPHTAIHAWTGDNRETYLEDMGNFYSAARDPIFYAHHSNVDRLWTVWNKLGGRCNDPTDPDFLNAEFVFYDEKARLVKVKVIDALDSRRLGVVYEKSAADKEWLEFQPEPLDSATRRRAAAAAPTTGVATPELGPAAEGREPARLVGGRLSTVATRPAGGVPEDTDEGEEVEEVLVLQGLRVPRNDVTHLAVFINLPEAQADTPLSCAEYVGSFLHIPHFVGPGMDMAERVADMRFGISDNLARLAIPNDVSQIPVTVVAVLGGDREDAPISIQGITIEYE